MKTYKQEEVDQKALSILKQSLTTRAGIINDFIDMSEGGDACGIREQYYPGKPNEYFSAVLDLVGYPEDSEEDSGSEDDSDGGDQ